MKTSKDRQVGSGHLRKTVTPVNSGPRIRKYYIFNDKIVNKDECIVQGRSSIQKGDYDQVEVHMHGLGDECPGMELKKHDTKCFRFGKGVQ